MRSPTRTTVMQHPQKAMKRLRVLLSVPGELHDGAVKEIREAVIAGEGQVKRFSEILGVSPRSAIDLLKSLGLQEYACTLRAAYGHHDPSQGAKVFREKRKKAKEAGE